jgi:GDPmannose 4,6-dehydratase
MLQQPEPGDWVVATGEARSVRQMCDYVFSSLGLNYQDYVVQNPKYLRPEELPYLRGDSTKIRDELGWKPKYTFEMLMDEMTEHWMQIYKA